MAEEPKPMNIEGRLAYERERLAGMTDADRAYRKQWLKDQQLSHNEPRHVPELYKERFNPIRRAYRLPLNLLFEKLRPILVLVSWGSVAESFIGEKTLLTRWVAGKVLLTGFTIFSLHYYFKYNSHDWTRKRGWYVFSSRPAIYPGDPRFPMVTQKEPSDFADYGFKASQAAASS